MVTLNALGPIIVAPSDHAKALADVPKCRRGGVNLGGRFGQQSYP
jgi:hypothetical protein